MCATKPGPVSLNALAFCRIRISVFSNLSYKIFGLFGKLLRNIVANTKSRSSWPTFMHDKWWLKRLVPEKMFSEVSPIHMGGLYASAVALSDFLE